MPDTRDPLAFTRLVRTHASTVCAITTAILGDARSGEEVAQEAFIAAWQGLGGLRDPSTFSAWLCQIARNRARNALKCRARRAEVSAELDRLPDPAADLADQVDDARSEAVLWTALDGMDDDHREVLVLYYRQDQSVRQVAERLGVDEPTVRKRLSRARARLRDDVEHTLGAHLRRTAPGLAFVLGVSAALTTAPLPARAATGSVAGGVAGALSLAALSWVALPCLGDAGPDGPRPSETRSGQASLARRAIRAPLLEAQPVLDEAPEEVRLQVRPGQWRPPVGGGRQFTVFTPDRFWPQRDEAPFPRGRRVAALVDYVAEGGHYQSPFTDEILARTGPLRTGVLPDDPWGALVALEVERLHAESDAGDEPLPDFDTLLALARGAQGAWPDHPVADYAAVYELRALERPFANGAESTEVGSLAMDLIRRSSDPYVLDAAITAVGNLGRNAGLTGDDLDLLSAHYDDPDARIPRYGLAALALETSLAMNDLDRAVAWSERHHEATEELCARTDTPEGRQRLRGQDDHFAGWLVARGVTAPATWQAAVLAIAHRCGEEWAVDAEITGEGRFDGAWHWGSWSADGPFADCVAATPVHGPHPPAGTAVTLEVLPPAG